MTGEWLAHCAACPLPEIANVFTRAGIDFHQVTGVLEADPHVDAEINDWIEAARVAHVMAHTKLGVMGRYYNGMLDIYSDMALQSAAFGTIIEIVEIDELAAIRGALTEDEITETRDRIAAEFDIQPDCAEDELRRAAGTFDIGARQFVEAWNAAAPAHHCAVGVGHIANRIEKLGALLGLEVIRVC